MQGNHTHIPETNLVPRGYIVAAILSLLFMVPLCLVPALVLLFFYYYYYYYYHHHHHHHHYHRLFSQVFSSWYFSWTSGDLHRSGFKFHAAGLSFFFLLFYHILIFLNILQSFQRYCYCPNNEQWVVQRRMVEKQWEREIHSVQQLRLAVQMSFCWKF